MKFKQILTSTLISLFLAFSATGQAGKPTAARRHFNCVTTSSRLPTTITTLPIAPDTTHVFETRITARCTGDSPGPVDDSAFFKYHFMALLNKQGEAVITPSGASGNVVIKTNPSFGVILTINRTDVLVQVIGGTDTECLWCAVTDETRLRTRPTSEKPNRRKYNA